MPESRKRKNVKPANKDLDNQPLNRSWAEDIPMSPRWWAPTSGILMLLGLLIVIVYYISEASLPIPNGGNWNIGLGILTAFIGFLMLLRWR